MDLIQAATLSIVEGVSEFLPISSTGHMVLFAKILAVNQSEFVKSFEIVIQFGAILAVVFIYWRRLLSNVHLWKQLLAAFLPTAVVGLALYKVIKNLLLGNLLVTVLALAIGGLVIIYVEKFYLNRVKQTAALESLSYKNAFLIGLIQSLSVIPGVSRAGATIIGGLMLGLKREQAVEFSFLLAIPTVMAASGLDLVKSRLVYNGSELMLLAVGLIGAFLSAMAVVKLFLKFTQRHNLVPFGIYRIVVAILFWLLVLGPL